MVWQHGFRRRWDMCWNKKILITRRPLEWENCTATTACDDRLPNRNSFISTSVENGCKTWPSIIQENSAPHPSNFPRSGSCTWQSNFAIECEEHWPINCATMCTILPKFPLNFLSSRHSDCPLRVESETKSHLILHVIDSPNLFLTSLNFKHSDCILHASRRDNRPGSPTTGDRGEKPC